MKRTFLAFSFLIAAAASAFAQSSPPITVTEADGVPRVNGVTTFVFDNGTVVCTGKSCRIANAGAGGGTVTSVAQTFTGGLISVGGSPVTSSGTLALTVAGTSGGIPYFSGASTWASSAALTANLPVIGGGAGVAPTVGTRSGNTTQFVTTTGAQTSGDCVKIDASGNHVANGSACGGSGSQTPWTSNIDAATFSLLMQDGAGIKSNEGGNAPLLLFTSVASGVDNLRVTNAATATKPIVLVETEGSDAAVSLHIKPKIGTYPNSGQVFFNSSVRYDEPSIAFYDVAFTTYRPGVGIGMKSGGSWLSLTAPNIMLGAGDGTPGYVGITGNSYLAWNVNNTAAEDCPACVAVGFNKPAQRVIGIVGADSTPDGDLTHGATFGFIANTPAQITSNQDNYDPGDTSYMQVWSSDASRNVTGMTFAISAKVSGQMHRIWNGGSNPIVLVNNASSSAANRFLTSTGTDITIAAKECADAQYDTAISNWRVTPCATSGSGGGVTSIATTGPITGGTITSTGTIACATCVTSPLSLSSNALVMGSNGAQAVKTIAGMTTDGVSTLTMGVAGTSVGTIVLNNGTSGTITLLPVTGALGTVTQSFPAATGTIALTTGSLTTNNCAKFDSSGRLVDSGGTCGGSGSPGTPTNSVQYNSSSSFAGNAAFLFTPSSTTGNEVAIADTTITSGNLVSIAASGTAAASNTKTALNVATSGANATSTQTTYGGRFTNTSTGTSSTNVGLDVSASGGTTNIGLQVSGGQLLTQLGTQAAPGLNIGTSITSTGFWGNGTRIQVSIANTVGPVFFGTGLYSKAAGLIAWDSSGDPANGTPDVGFQRNAAGVIEVNNGATANAYRDIKVRQYFADATQSASSGNQTINKSAFSFVLATGTSNAIITNSFVTTTSLVFCTVQTNDTTLKSAAAVPASGSVQVFGSAAATADTVIACTVLNK